MDLGSDMEKKKEKHFFPLQLMLMFARKPYSPTCYSFPTAAFQNITFA